MLSSLTEKSNTVYCILVINNSTILYPCHWRVRHASIYDHLKWCACKHSFIRHEYVSMQKRCSCVCCCGSLNEWNITGESLITIIIIHDHVKRVKSSGFSVLKSFFCLCPLSVLASGTVPVCLIRDNDWCESEVGQLMLYF